MPTSKDIASYPIEMLVVVERVLTERGKQDVVCTDNKEAQKLRQQIYGLRKALTISDHPLRELAPQLVVQVSDQTLTMLHVDQTVPEGLRKAAGL